MSEQTFRYSNETFSGCDMTASITINMNTYDSQKKKMIQKPYTKILGEIQTISYSIHMEKRPIRSIGNVNAKDYVMGPRTIAGSLVFSVFNKHFAEDIIQSLNTGYSAGTAYLVDELPPFDITISAANEYGYRSSLVIFGVRLLNEGQVMSINDVYTENTYQFFATDLQYLSSEMSYVRNKETKMYKLNDNLQSHKRTDNTIYGDFKYKWTKEQQDNYNRIINRNITLLASVKQPTHYQGKGIVNFSIDPYQESGTIYITSSNKEQYVLGVKALSNNKTNHASISLPSEEYTAYFQNANKKKSNTVKFKIDTYYKEDLLYRYAPIIELVTDSSIQIYSNEPSHNMAAISLTDNDEIISIELTNRRGTFTNLTPNKKYIIYTYNTTDKLKSKKVNVQTLTTKDKLFSEFELYCYANSRLLAFKDFNTVYKPLLVEAKSIAEKSNYDTSDALVKLKDNYINKLKNLDKQKDENYNTLLETYNLKIKQINELIHFALKLKNNFIIAVNEKIDVPIPTTFLNDSYDNIFTFDEKITSAEFYKNYGNIMQFQLSTPSYNFTCIDGIDNSFKYLGKPGMKHYVEALENQARSPKLDFYVMSQKEKDEFIQKDLDRQKITDKEKEQIDDAIIDELGKVEDEEYKRSFMINAKKIENPIISPPQIETIDENVLVRTSLFELIANEYENKFYLAIATYEDVLCNNDIYKIEFTNKEEVIAITKMLHGLKDNTEYAIWIEDENLNQISNVSTFMYNKDFDLDNDELKHYELSSITQGIKSIANKYLSTETYENIQSFLDNDQRLTSYNIIENVLSIVYDSTIQKKDFIGFCTALKSYIGTLTDSSNMFSNIEYKDGFLNFDSEYTGSILMYSLDKESCTINKTKLDINNSINSSCYNCLLLIGIDEKLLNKSQLIIVNNKEKYMEVL